jgi:hypothetical protein
MAPPSAPNRRVGLYCIQSTMTVMSATSVAAALGAKGSRTGLGLVLLPRGCGLGGGCPTLAGCRCLASRRPPRSYAGHADVGGL